MRDRPVVTVSPLLALLILLSFMAFNLGCSSDDNPAEPQDNDDPTSPSEIHVDQGDIGVVIDTRSIFKRGYQPLTVEIGFADYPDLDITLDVDQTTHFAILKFPVADLPETTVADLADGTPLAVTINGPDKAVLAQYSDMSQVVDDSNLPLVLTTDLPFIPQPVVLETDMAYLIQIQGHGNLLTQGAGIYLFDLDIPYAIDEPDQQFYFTPVDGMESTFEMSTVYGSESLMICISEDVDPHIIMDHDHYLPTAQFTLVPDEEGWVRFQEVSSGEYLCLGDIDYMDDYTIDLGGDTPLKFRLICDDIAWMVVDRGTTANQPIMPAAQLDFAYRGELQNCAPGELTDSIGTTEERSWEVSASTTEGFQLFSSLEQSLGIEVGMSVSASIGADIGGLVEASGEVEFSTNVSYSETYTVAETTTQENTWAHTTSGSKTVSHTRDYVVPPYTAVLIRDAVKTVRDVRVPFTQLLRVTGTTRDLGRTLTGEEIRSQMLFNFVGGVIKTVGDDYVDISLRGFTVVDQMFEATTYVDEIEGACD